MMANLKPNFTLPDVDLDELAETVARVAKDAVYITVGAGVLAFQRAQVQRREFQEGLDARLGAGREQVETVTATVSKSIDEQVRVLEERVTALEERIDAALDQVQSKLPEQAAELLQQARDAARTAGAQVRELVFPPAKPAAAPKKATAAKKATKATRKPAAPADSSDSEVA